MRYTIKFFTALAIVILPSLANADQCAWITAGPAARLEDLDRAGKISGNRYVEYCKPCGDKSPNGPYLISQLRKKKIDATYTEYYFVVNGVEKPVDLAYVFIQTGQNRYINLGKATDCKAMIENSSEINLQ